MHQNQTGTGPILLASTRNLLNFGARVVPIVVVNSLSSLEISIKAQ